MDFLRILKDQMAAIIIISNYVTFLLLFFGLSLNDWRESVRLAEKKKQLLTHSVVFFFLAECLMNTKSKLTRE